MDSPIPHVFILGAETEADTCRKEVTPKLKAGGWDDDRILEQRTFTSGKVVVLGRKGKRQKAKKADYILCCSTDFPSPAAQHLRR